MSPAVRTLSVWVVDDEAIVCRMVQRMLDHCQDPFPDLDKTISYRVLALGSGEEFLNCYKSGKPDILLLDGKLPGIDGFGILEQLHQTKTATVTVMISAYASLDKAVQATKLGAWDFLAKPFTPDELRNTVRKAAQNFMLSETARQLEENSHKLRFNFLSVLAHELKSPINAIEGYVRLIESRQAGNDLNQYDTMIKRIGFRAAGMRKLIGDLLDLTRIEAGKDKRTLQQLDLRQLADSSAELHRDAATAESVSLQVNVENGISLIGDGNEIEMLFNNLISNAIKYNRKGGSVILNVKQTGPAVRITCKDTGIGMTPEETGRLFREFSRIKNEHTRSIPGSGLGLTIVQKIAGRYNGTVSVESTPNQGTTFTIELLTTGSPPPGPIV